jgi:hypothetical protein
LRSSLDSWYLRRHLAGVDVEHPRLDRDRAERALQAHLERLGAHALPVRWVADAKAGLTTASEARLAVAAMGASREAKGEARRALELMKSLHDDPAWTWKLWPPAETAARCQPWAAAGSAALWPDVEPSLRRELVWWGSASAVDLAADAVIWSAVRSSAPRSAGKALLSAVERWLGIVRPLVDAYEAGLWLFWVLEQEVVAVPRPALRLEDGRLHSEDGPAVFWPDGPRYWFWRGVQVPQRVIEAAETLSAAEIAAEQNVEVRRAMIERFGVERYLRESDACKVGVDETGTLRRLQLPGEEPALVVEVVDSTPQPDGSHRRYFLRVPPYLRTPREAVAWTFGFEDPREYGPEVEA